MPPIIKTFFNLEVVEEPITKNTPIIDPLIQKFKDITKAPFYEESFIEQLKNISVPVAAAGGFNPTFLKISDFNGGFNPQLLKIHDFNPKLLKLLN